MSDVWKGLEERLKQKAKSDAEIKRCMHLTEEQMQTIHKLPPKEIQNYLDKLSEQTKWVRLKVVQKLIEEIKQTHYVIKKDNLDAILQQFPIQPIGTGALLMGSKEDFRMWFKNLKELLKE